MEDKLKRDSILEELARLAKYKDFNYETDEIKDGRIISMKNIKISKIEHKNG